VASRRSSHHGISRSAHGPRTSDRPAEETHGHHLVITRGCRLRSARHRHPCRTPRRRVDPPHPATPGSKRGPRRRTQTRVYRLATSPDTFESDAPQRALADPSRDRHRGRRCPTVGVPARVAARHPTPPRRPRLDADHPRRGAPTFERDRRGSMPSNGPTASVVASPPRAWFDCARDVDDERFERLTEWVLDRHCARAHALATQRSGCRREVGPDSAGEAESCPASRLAEAGGFRTRTARAERARSTWHRARPAASARSRRRNHHPSRRSRPLHPLGVRDRPRHLARRTPRCPVRQDP
jgi:hypothetical protein